MQFVKSQNIFCWRDTTRKLGCVFHRNMQMLHNS